MSILIKAAQLVLFSAFYFAVLSGSGIIVAHLF